VEVIKLPPKARDTSANHSLDASESWENPAPRDMKLEDNVTSTFTLPVTNH